MKHKVKDEIHYRAVINSRAIAVIGLVCALIFGAATIAAAISNAGAFACIVFGALAVLGIILILTVNQRVDYNDKGFTYRDMLRLTHRYEYSQVKKIRYGGDLTVTVGKRLILIDENAFNIDGFAKELIRNSKNAEVISHKKTKLFGGNIRNPGEFILIDAVIMAFPVFLFAVSLLSTQDIKPDEISICTGRITEYHFDRSDDGNKFVITVSDKSAEKQTFVTGFVKENSREFKDIEINTAKNRDFEIGYIDNDDEKDAETDICLLSCGGTQYVSIDDVNGAIAEKRKSVLVLSGVIFALAMLFVAVSTYIMSNADKYPRLVRLFVKEDYIIRKSGSIRKQ